MLATRLNPNSDKCSDDIARIGTWFAFERVSRQKLELFSLSLTQGLFVYWGHLRSFEVKDLVGDMGIPGSFLGASAGVPSSVRTLARWAMGPMGSNHPIHRDLTTNSWPWYWTAWPFKSFQTQLLPLYQKKWNVGPHINQVVTSTHQRCIGKILSLKQRLIDFGRPMAPRNKAWQEDGTPCLSVYPSRSTDVLSTRMVLGLCI